MTYATPVLDDPQDTSPTDGDPRVLHSWATVRDKQSGGTRPSKNMPPRVEVTASPSMVQTWGMKESEVVALLRTGLPWLLVLAFALYNIFKMVRFWNKGLADPLALQRDENKVDVAPVTASHTTTTDGQVSKTMVGALQGDGTAQAPPPPVVPPPTATQPPPAPDTQQPSDGAAQGPHPSGQPTTKEVLAKLQDIRVWIDDALHSVESRSKSNMKAALEDNASNTAAMEGALDKFFRKAFSPLGEKLILEQLKQTLGPFLDDKGKPECSIRQTLHDMEDALQSTTKLTSDAAWDTGGRFQTVENTLESIVNRLNDFRQDLSAKVMNTQRKVGGLAGTSKAAGVTSTPENEVLKLLCQFKEFQEVLMQLGQTYLPTESGLLKGS